MTTNPITLEQLIANCKNGNQLAQLELYKRFYKAMYNTALRIVKQPEEAEDVMQESFLIAFKKIYSLNETEKFGGWLKRIVINESLQIIKQNNNINFFEVDNNTLRQTEDSNFDATEIEFNEKNSKLILNALKKLKPNYATILSLLYIEGYDYEECCEILNLSYANCRTLSSRAKDSLKKIIIKDGRKI